MDRASNTPIEAHGSLRNHPWQPSGLDFSKSVDEMLTFRLEYPFHDLDTCFAQDSLGSAKVGGIRIGGAINDPGNLLPFDRFGTSSSPATC